MSEHVYGIKRLVGSSTSGSDEAVRNALSKMGEGEDKIRWFEVVETRGHVEQGEIAHWQVTVDIGYQA